MHQITKRLLPGQDLRKELERLVQEHGIKAGALLSLVGALSHAALRMAGAKPDHAVVKQYDGPFEIVSATGTVSINGCHIHLSISDQEGNVKGGHLKEGCIVAMTAEVVMLVFDDVVYRRLPDPKTGFDELVVTQL